MKTVTLICINYDSYQELNNFLKSIASQEFEMLELTVIVVDNTLEKARREKPNAAVTDRFYWLLPEKNLGYYGGANFAYEKIVRRAPAPDFLIVCNVDLYFEEKDFLARLCSLEVSNNVEIIAPRIIGSRTKAELNPFLLSPPNLKRINRIRVFFHFYPVAVAYQMAHVLKAWTMASLTKKKNTYEAMRNIYAPHGAFIVFTKRFFFNGGSLAHPCFLYGEELFVAEQVLTHRGDVIFVPQLSVIHTEHASTGWIKSRAIIRFQHAALVWACNWIGAKRRSTTGSL